MSFKENDVILDYIKDMVVDGNSVIGDNYLENTLFEKDYENDGREWKDFATRPTSKLLIVTDTVTGRFEFPTFKTEVKDSHRIGTIFPLSVGSDERVVNK